MKDKHLSPEARTRVEMVLAQTDWNKTYPKFADRLTAYREAKERITQRVLADMAAAQAREDAAKAREAQAEQERISRGTHYVY